LVVHGAADEPVSGLVAGVESVVKAVVVQVTGEP
jgi:hypothetical protein